MSAVLTETPNPIERLADYLPNRYSPETRSKALELSDSGLTPAQIAKETGANKATVYYWLEARSTEKTLDNSLDLASRFEKAASLFIELAVKKARKANFSHLMTGAGIAIDKMQLLRGQPTSISQSVISDEERQVKMAEIFSRLEARAIESQADVKPAELSSADPNE